MFCSSSPVNNISNTNLPESVANAVLEVASEQLSVSISQLRITQVQQQTWRDKCLGLPHPTEKCIGTPTPGWQVTLESRQQFYAYRTNNSGSQVRTEAIIGLPPRNEDLPYLVAEAVLQQAQAHLNVSLSELRVIQAEPHTWPDACLGLASPGELCTQALVPGWQVTIKSNRQLLLYRTNDSGSLVRAELDKL